MHYILLAFAVAAGILIAQNIEDILGSVIKILKWTAALILLGLLASLLWLSSGYEYIPAILIVIFLYFTAKSSNEASAHGPAIQSATDYKSIPFISAKFVLGIVVFLIFLLLMVASIR